MTTDDFYVLALDLGTFSGRCLLIDQQGQLVDSEQQSISLNRISPRRIEQDAEQILDAMQSTLQRILQKHADKLSKIRSAGLATQRSSIVAWRPSNGEILSPVLSWQDTRAYRNLEPYQDRAGRIQQLTGLRLTAHYGVTKMQWLLDNDARVVAAVAQQDCVVTPLASLVLFHLCQTQQVLIDSANAARTLLCSLLQQDWEPELLKLFAIDSGLLPEVKPIQYDFGTIKSSQIRLTALNGDQAAALYANGDTHADSLYVNLGTGAFVLTPIARDLLGSSAFQQSGLLAGISRSDETECDYYMEGTVNGAGAALDWLQEFDPSSDIQQQLQDPMRQQQKHDLLFINAVGGIGSPIWRSDLKPVFINDNGKAEDRLSAVLESIVFLLMLNIEAMVKLKPGIGQIEISGGLSNNAYVCQCLADLSGVTVVKRPTTEATARGIAWLAMQDHAHWINRGKVINYHAASNQHLLLRYASFKDQLS